MKFSRSKINRVGEIISQQKNDRLEVAEALLVIEQWRQDHAIVLQELFRQVSALLDTKKIKYAFSSQRLKRMTSIIDKLKHHPEMRLGGVQDIGGARFVFESTEFLAEAKEAIMEASFDGFTIDREPYDYVTRPKDSGYRSIHFAFMYHSDNESLDGKRVELQIRTRLQHDWATAVETAELISKSALKAGIGDESWLSFFQLVSAIFAKKENLPVNGHFSSFTEKEYCEQYVAIIEKYRFLEKFESLVGAVSFTEEQSFKEGYVVLFVNYSEKRARVRHFNESDLDKANALYSQIEGTISNEDGAVVLVSVSDMKELTSAYPSYFMNAQEFLSSLSEFSDHCRVKGYIR